MNAKDRLCVALDSSDHEWIAATAADLAGHVGWLKLGLEAFTAHGPALVREIAAIGPRIFLDLKLHDIPATVRRAAANCAAMGVSMVTVHTAGGPAMLEAAVAGAREGSPVDPPKVVAVTLLTSLDRASLSELEFERPADELVGAWASLARRSGADGVVASAREAGGLRQQFGDELLIVTPGIRPAGMTADDQRRVMTPADAIAAGADVLVVGRPITGADDPVAAAHGVVAEMALAEG